MILVHKFCRMFTIKDKLRFGAPMFGRTNKSDRLKMIEKGTNSRKPDCNKTFRMIANNNFVCGFLPSQKKSDCLVKRG